MPQTSTVKSPLEMMYRWESETPDLVFLRQAENSQWHEYSWRQVTRQIRRLATFIISKSYKPGSRIAIWSANSKDWVIADLAIMLSGHISVPIYPGQDTKSANYILQHSQVEMLFIGAFDAAAQFANIETGSIETVAMMGASVECGASVSEICADDSAYEPYTESPIPEHEDTFTIIYTSGTTGNPKGVMHKHSTPGHVIPGIADAFDLEAPDSRLFSFLPMAHAAERILIELGGLYCNASISFSAGLETFAEEIRSVQPTFFFAVPRLWIKFKESVDANIPPAHQAMLSDEQKQGIAMQLGLAKAKYILTGSAPCPIDVQDWFADKGVVLRDGYGMTENFIHGIAWTKSDTPKSGCVGQPMTEEVEVRLSDVGEIEFRSKGLMKGYYKEPEKTAEVLVDGWYKTGDSGRIDGDGDLWVTGRISETFKTSKGKFVVPSNIESKLGSISQLAQYCVVGHGMTAPILLATLSESGQASDRESLAEELGHALSEVNDALNPWEKISNIIVTPEWTIENSLLTPTMKLKRNAIQQSCQAIINGLREAGSEAKVVHFYDA